MSTNLPAIPEWANPGDNVVTGELVGSIDPVKWSEFIGCIASGVTVPESLKRAGVTRYAFNGAIRTSATAKEQYNDAKLAAAWRNWDYETVEEILGALMLCEQGGHLKRIVEDRGLDVSSFYLLMNRDPEVKELYEEARQIQAEAMADEMQEIADYGLNDTYSDRHGNRKVDNDVVQRSRIRVDTMKWRMSKLHHKRFGDRIQQDQNINMVVDHAERLEAGRRRLEELHKQRASGKK